jgi:hypothetical protein
LNDRSYRKDDAAEEQHCYHEQNQNVGKIHISDASTRGALESEFASTGASMPVGILRFGR